MCKKTKTNSDEKLKKTINRPGINNTLIAEELKELKLKEKKLEKREKLERNRPMSMRNREIASIR